MGKLKVKDWQYRSALNAPITPPNNGLNTAIRLAGYQFNQYKAAKKTIAIDRAIKETTDEIENRYTDWDLGCAAIILSRRYGYEAEEIANFLTDIQDLMRGYILDGLTHEEIWDIVRDEVGLDIERDY